VSQFGISWVGIRGTIRRMQARERLTAADFGLADTYFGSSASFNAILVPKLFVLSDQEAVQFARSLGFGVLNPYRDTLS